MKFIKINDIDPIKTFFHFSRIDSRESIEKNGLQAVAGGENEAAKDRNNKTIYFSKGINGVLKLIDVWARCEYDRYAMSTRNTGHKINYGYQGYDREVMRKIIFEKLYNDFKNRQYYTIDLIEGEDFEYDDIDVKKEAVRYFDEKTKAKAVWEYGPYSQWGTEDNPNNLQEDWNRNTKIGNRTISSDRLKIIETQNGRSDALSVIIAVYNRYRTTILKENDYMFEILDNFIEYAKKRYREDVDYSDGAKDRGRRDIIPEEEEKYMRINGIRVKTQNLGEQAKINDENYIAETASEITRELEKRDMQH